MAKGNYSAGDVIVAADTRSVAPRQFASQGSIVWDLTDPGFISADVQFGDTAGTVCEGNDARLSDARTPTSHGSTHLPDGADPTFGKDTGWLAPTGHTDRKSFDETTITHPELANVVGTILNALLNRNIPST